MTQVTRVYVTPWVNSVSQLTIKKPNVSVMQNVAMETRKSGIVVFGALFGYEGLRFCHQIP